MSVKFRPNTATPQLKVEMICPQSRALSVSATWKTRRTFISGRRKIQ
jgi:hypothetical protein